MGCEGYGALAHVYDRLNADIDYEAWADFVVACFDRFLTARPELVLDLACGTGRMTVPLANRGFDMLGIDGSEDMLSEAFLAGEGKGILFLCQDMRRFELYGTVGAITCCLDSVNYLLTEQDLAACFACVHNYLEPDGLFLFDMNTPYKFRNIYGDNAYVMEDELIFSDGDGEGDSALVYCGWQNAFDEKSGICDFYLSLFEQLPNGDYRRSDEHQQERCYTLDTVKRLLQEAGMELLGVYSDFDFRAPEETTPRWYIAARAIK